MLVQSIIFGSQEVLCEHNSY